LNLSKSGASVSARTRVGSIGTRGFSIRSGIPGLGYRRRWGSGSSVGALLGLVVALFSLVLVLIPLAVTTARIAFWLLVMVPVNIAIWLVATLFDLVVHLVRKLKANEMKR